MKKRDNNVVPLHKVPSKTEAQRIIRKLAEEGKIEWSSHFKKRLNLRKITTLQVLNCLLAGQVTEAPFFSHRNGGGYETCVEKGCAGNWLKVVVCLKLEQNLLVMTVIN
jgi:hypothetical protein